MKKKQLVTLLGGILLALLLMAIPFLGACAPAPAPTPKLPEVITMTTLPEGTAKYTQGAAFRAAVEKFTPMKLRLESAGTEMERVGPIILGEGELAFITGGMAGMAAKGEEPFKELGPTPIRRVWNGYPFVGAMAGRGDADFKTIADLRGKRIPKSPGGFEYSTSNAGVIAFGGLTLNDVKLVTVAGIRAALKGPLEGTLDACYTSLFGAAMLELAASRHGIHWFDMPATDVEGWKRVKEVAPYLNPMKAKAAGLKEGETINGAGFEDGVFSTSAVSEDIVYAFCQAMYKGIDTYKEMHKGLLKWTWERAYTLEVIVPDVPYHAATVKFFKEMGVWSAAHEEFQKNALKAEKERLGK